MRAGPQIPVSPNPSPSQRRKWKVRAIEWPEHAHKQVKARGTQAGTGILHTGKPPSSGPQHGLRATGVSTSSLCCCLPTAPSQTSPYRRRLHVHDFPAQNNYHSWCFLKGNPSVCNIHLDGAMGFVRDESYGQTQHAWTVVADQCPLLCRSSLLCKRQILIGILMNFLETVCVCTCVVQEGQRNSSICVTIYIYAYVCVYM